MQEHMNQFQKTFITMAAEYTEHVRREIAAANEKGPGKKCDDDTFIRLGPAMVTLEDKVQTANLLMVTIDRMRRENGDRVPFGDLHVEVAKPESVARGDALRSCMTKMFNAWAAGAKDGGCIVLTEDDLREAAAFDGSPRTGMQQENGKLRVGETPGVRHGTRSAEVIQVIKTTAVTGKGTRDDMCRIITQFWSLDGELLAEKDPVQNNQKE